VTTFVQRYPKSPVYEDNENFNIDVIRNSVWKWIGATVLALCLFTPMLSLLTEIVRERQYLMKDLLEISGMMNISYYFSYLFMLFLLGEFSCWFTIGIMNGFGIITDSRVGPYAALMSAFVVSSAAFSIAFGFVIPRSEYYGLPVFLTTCALTVCGAYLAIAYNISMGLKLFFCFVSPSIGLTMGVIVIETFLFANGGDMNYHAVNHNKQYPDLYNICMVLLCSALFYFLLTLALPLDWLWKLTSSGDNLALNKQDDLKYPCDQEENATVKENAGPVLLDVDSLTQVYPDGTSAVKDMSFKVRKGEVLSFLGANGAGKSTTMKMLCGTLDSTYGDANVNGYSITNEKTLARRNLGIAMQQDIIWDDVNVEDHLMLFGRLRGLHGKELRDAVTNMVESVGFPDKRKAMAGTLSGGQKRRLCVALSMVGGNAVVYLDEPTAGLDPVSRRQLWELVQRNREGRAILLTTHFMDEADVLGDRIAIVKEGRLRAVGTAKFLKQRFGLGYLLRMSLAENTNPAPIMEEVKSFIPEASMASSAGTELSIRLPREAVSLFPTVFERIEQQSDRLGIRTYGIETTTLEEVFMRIVNEDTEQLLNDHDHANRLLTATKEEVDANRKVLEKRDNERVPISDEDIDALLVKGLNALNAGSAFLFPLQTQVMVIKRFYQFVRSRGQWMMGFVLPIVMAILVGLLLSTMPTDLLHSDPVTVVPFSSNLYPTLVTGPNQAYAQSNIAKAFTGQPIDIEYVGQTYSQLFTDIYGVANAGMGASSISGIYYQAVNNFSVLYNASYPMNFAADVQNLLNYAVANATNDMLVIDQTYNQLPNNQLDAQLNNGFFIAMLISLVAGAFGAGLSIVVSGERVTLVKHQQLASGASSFAYWVGNFIFDFGVIFLYVLIFGVMLVIFSPSTFSGSGYGYVVGPGFFFTIASVMRFYSISYLISDIRLAQSLYFYGSLAIVFVLVDVWFTVLFTTANGNINDGAVQTVGAIFACLDPTFAWYTIILYQNNWLAIQTSNPGASFWSTEVAGLIFIMLIMSAIIYSAIFIFLTENALVGCFRSIGEATSNVTSGTRKSMIASDNTEEAGNIVVISNTNIKEYEKTDIESNGNVERSLNSQDPDVIREREKVKKIVERGIVNRNGSAIFINNLRKVYYARGNVPAKVAVKNINLSIPQGEIFGLLGANGAGKTTLLKMVSGLEQPTSGFALINGYDVVQQTSQAQRSMGLCPQFDTLIERLTVRENLLFFGRIKGLSNEKVVPVCEAFMKAMNIKRYEHKLIQQLSGGNRRKVSLAVALLGAPPTVYLDEPSTGLDPVASRLMWRLLSKIAAAKSTAVVLTTHNMLECEAVCTRVCIMKLGEMVCLGDSQHLRSTHGTGFLLELNLIEAAAKDRAKEVRKFILSLFPEYPLMFLLLLLIIFCFFSKLL
jgi:ATP-binding cassette subfamily A (ABC1) protein 3